MKLCWLVKLILIQLIDPIGSAWLGFSTRINSVGNFQLELALQEITVGIELAREEPAVFTF